MGDAKALATAHLEKARLELDQAKSRYEEAVAAFQSAKTIYEALEASQPKPPKPNDLRNSLCEHCRTIPIASLFELKHSASKTNRRKVGDLFHAVNNQSSCILCKFLIEAFQIGSESRPERLHAHLKPRDTAIYLATDPYGKAWYTKASVDTNLPSCPFLWLQTGPPTATGEPHICISFESSLNNGNEYSGLSPKAWPRKREPLEIFNGSLDYDLLRSWIRKCETKHKDECDVEDDLSTLPLDIHLIDVKARKLVRRRAGDRFVALSYVWGKSPQAGHPTVQYGGAVARDDKATDQTNPNYIGDLPARIPQTIEDSIQLTNHIGERFLWVDQLCIDQTEGEHKQQQINIMDKIYKSAHLTINNLDGVDSDWGLPGVSRPLLQTQQPTVQLECGRLMATFVYSNWDNAGRCILDTRGWTLQERLLARRRIVLAKTQYSMVCGIEAFHDCLMMTPSQDGVTFWLGDDYFREDGSGIKLDDTEWDFKIYNALISVYSGRDLTNQGDILNACRGSLNRLSEKCGVKFLFGQPINDFLRALIWTPHHEHVLTRRQGFPSWSWAGWIGRIEYHYWVGDMAAYITDHAQQIPKERSYLKRRHSKITDSDGLHMRRARLVKIPDHDCCTSALALETMTAKFRLQLMRRNGDPHRNLKSSSQQSKTAIGDHWTLLQGDGTPLRDEAGEYPIFETRDSFFRLSPEYSDILLALGCEADFVFVEHWPCTRGSETSDKWLYDMVSLLLIIRNDDGTVWRLASVLLKADEWCAKDPQLETIHLV